jgi:hypothetical protein
MPFTGKYMSFSDDENSASLVKEHSCKLYAPEDLAQAPKHHQQRNVLQDLCLNARQPPLYREKVMLQIREFSYAYNLYSSSIIITMIKSRRMRWAGHVA